MPRELSSVPEPQDSADPYAPELISPLAARCGSAGPCHPDGTWIILAGIRDTEEGLYRSLIPLDTSNQNRTLGEEQLDDSIVDTLVSATPPNERSQPVFILRR